MKKIFCGLAAVMLLFAGMALGQVTTGELAGTVKDSQGALVTSATISVTSESQGTTSVVKTNNSGEYRLGSLLPALYDIKVEAAGFKAYTIKAVTIDLNKTSTIDAVLSVSATTAVEVTTEAAVNLDTTSNNLTSTFNNTEITELPTTASGYGALNASLLAPNVASNGGVGVGTGPSIGGQRPRDNNFTIEGVDDNEKSVTGPMVLVPSDATAEFTVITSQFSPEFGHSTGGQFNTTVVSGTNTLHGKAVEYFQNRNLNAASGIQGGKAPNGRYDANTYGGQVGGPIIHNKLFFFGLYERGTVGQSKQYYICTPTAAGIATLNGLVGPYGLSTANVAQYVQYTPVSPTQVTSANDVACHNQPAVAGVPTPQTFIVYQGTSFGPQVNGANVVNPTKPYASSTSAGGIYGSGASTNIPLGNYLIQAPNYSNARTVVSSADYTLSSKDNFRFRYIYHSNASADTSAELPAFYAFSPLKQHFGSLSEFHIFTPNLTNEVRIGYHREGTATPVGSQTFPGLGSFPNLQFNDQGGGTQYGPDPNGPQSGIQNIYQLVDNVTYNRGKHLFTVGFDGRKAIAPQSFTQRVRGDYEWGYITEYFHDLGPTSFGQRSTGNFFYYGDQTALYGYANDTWRATPKLTLNYGLRYEFTSVPTGERAQALNIGASVPGLITFTAPKPQYKNFAPRIGVAYAPDEKTSVRAGFGIAYDVLFDNLGLLSFPPQYSATTNVVAPNQTPVGGVYPAEPAYYFGQNNFLANGGLPAGTGTLNTYPTVAAQRAATSAYLPNQSVPYSETWSLTVQRVIAKDFTAEIQYLGSHDVHLVVQDQINKQAKVTPANQLTTYLTGTTLSGAGTSATVATGANANTLAAISALSNIVPAYLAAGFTTSITSYQPFGMSNYNGLGLNLSSRMRRGLQFAGSYTYSKTMDNSTTEVNADALSQRRPQDSQNVAADYSRSALDRRNRLTLEFVYQEPFFQHSHLYLKDTLGGWVIAPIYTYESPEYVTAISGTNANLNGDSSSISRTIANNAGNKSLGSAVVPTYSTNPALVALCTPPATTCSANLVGYTALNPSAYYIQAGSGTLPTTARNTLPGRPIDNIDMTVSKKIAITERLGFEFQAIAYNVLNHAQYVPGSVDSVGATNTSAASSAYLNASNPAFNNPGLEWSNSARSMQLVGKFIF